MPANKNKCAHRAAVALQTFLPCSESAGQSRDNWFKTLNSLSHTIQSTRHNNSSSKNCAHLPTVRITRTWRVILALHQQCFNRCLYLCGVVIGACTYLVHQLLFAIISKHSTLNKQHERVKNMYCTSKNFCKKLVIASRALCDFLAIVLTHYSIISLPFLWGVGHYRDFDME